MTVRIIVKLEERGDKTNVSVYGETEGKDHGSVGLAIAAALLKKRIKKAVSDFDPEKATLGDIAQLLGEAMELHELKAKEGEVSHE